MPNVTKCNTVSLISKAFDHIDDDGNGTIEFGEFKVWFAPI